MNTSAHKSMHSIKTTFATLISILVLFSSSSSKEEQVEQENLGLTVINIDEIPMRDDIRLTDLIAEYEYIPLETSDAGLIGEITNIAFDDDLIFIHDRRTKALLVFNTQGAFLHKLSASGNGPEEFMEIESFTIDKEKRHIILGITGKILIFDYQGKFIDGFKAVYGGAFQIAYTGDDKLLVFTGPMNLSEEKGFNQASIIDLKTHEIVTKAIPFNPNARVENMTMFFNNTSYADKDNKYLSVPYKNSIWRVSGDSVSVGYQLDFGGNSLPKDYEDKYLSDPKYESGDLRKMEAKENWAKLYGGGALFSRNMLYFYYSVSGKYIQVFYDLNTNKSFQVKSGIENDLDRTRYISYRTAHKNKFVSWISPSTLKEKVASGEISKNDIVQLAESLEEEDNPVLRLLTFKPIQ